MNYQVHPAQLNGDGETFLEELLQLKKIN